MIKKDKIWVWSYNLNNKLQDEKSVGKWLLNAKLDYFVKIFNSIDTLVENGVIYRAKYSHKERIDLDPLPLSPPVLCVYADDLSKESTLQELLKLGIKPISWKYEYQTTEEWKPGGLLFEESKKQRLEYLLRKLSN